MTEFTKRNGIPGSEARPDGTPEERATSRHLDPRRDGHVWPDLAVSASGVQMPGAEIDGREFEGGALNSAASEAREHLSLTINRLIETTPLQRGKHCGRFTVKNNRTLKYHRVYCKCWDCSWCGPRKAKRLKWAIRSTAELYGLNRLVSLTLDPKLLDGENSVEYLNQTFAKLRTYLKRHFGTPVTYIRVLEFQKNGTAHFHILIDRYIPQQWLQKAWQAVGGGRQVNVKYVDIHRASRYLSKYLTKELLMSAPKRSRRVTTSRSIHLLEKKPKEDCWEFIRLRIEPVALARIGFLVSLEFDEGGALSAFQDAPGPVFEQAA